MLFPLLVHSYPRYSQTRLLPIVLVSFSITEPYLTLAMELWTLSSQLLVHFCHAHPTDGDFVFNCWNPGLASQVLQKDRWRRADL